MPSKPAPVLFTKPLRSIHLLKDVIGWYRERADLTPEALAHAAGVTGAQVQAMEAGNFSAVSAQDMFNVLMVLRIDLSIQERPRPTAVDIERESYARRFRERP